MAQKKKTVLFVDDDLSLLEILRQLMSHYAGEQWQVLTAPDVSKGLGILQERRVDLLVFDIQMPVVDGVQFLKLLQRKYPNLLKVVLTGFASEENRAACLNDGAELYLEKPRDQGGWQGIYATLHELSRFQPEEGFRGVLRQVGLQDVLQMECLARHSVVLKVSAGTLEGHVFVKDGQIIHAVCGSLRGEEAFHQIMGLTGGEFDVQPFTEPPEQSITGQWEFLLMEAARKRDETHEDAANPASASCPVVIPDFFGPTAGKSPSPEVKSTPAPPSPAGRRPAPPPAVAAPDAAGVAIPKLIARAPSAPVPASPPAPASANLRPQTDELLVCSLQGEVMHEWKCANPNGRISFLEFISQKARLIAEALPLGQFDRLEVNAATTRMVAQLQADRALFLRASQRPAEGEAKSFAA